MTQTAEDPVGHATVTEQAIEVDSGGAIQWTTWHTIGTKEDMAAGAATAPWDR